MRLVSKLFLFLPRKLNKLKHEKVKFEVDGFSLNGVLTQPTTRTNNAIILLHPHPLYGGDKDNHVVKELDQLFLEMGFITMRFNLRGGPNTYGRYCGISGAVEDTYKAIEFIEKYGLHPLGLVGYSFGGSTAFRVATMRPLSFLVTLSASYQLFLEGGYDESHLTRIRCPVLMFHGRSDNMIPHTDLKAFSSLVSGIKMVSLENENHFYQYALPEVLNEIRSFISAIFGGESLQSYP